MARIIIRTEGQDPLFKRVALKAVTMSELHGPHLLLDGERTEVILILDPSEVETVMGWTLDSKVWRG